MNKTENERIRQTHVTHEVYKMALDRLEDAEKNIRMARAGMALALADLHE